MRIRAVLRRGKQHRPPSQGNVVFLDLVQICRGAVPRPRYGLSQSGRFGPMCGGWHAHAKPQRHRAVLTAGRIFSGVGIGGAAGTVDPRQRPEFRDVAVADRDGRAVYVRGAPDRDRTAAARTSDGRGRGGDDPPDGGLDQQREGAALLSDRNRAAGVPDLLDCEGCHPRRFCACARIRIGCAGEKKASGGAIPSCMVLNHRADSRCCCEEPAEPRPPKTPKARLAGRAANVSQGLRKLSN